MRPGGPSKICHRQVGLWYSFAVAGAVSEDDDAIGNLEPFFLLAGHHENGPSLPGETRMIS
jgi:hypothetical protein